MKCIRIQRTSISICIPCLVAIMSTWNLSFKNHEHYQRLCLTEQRSENKGPIQQNELEQTDKMTPSLYYWVPGQLPLALTLGQVLPHLQSSCYSSNKTRRCPLLPHNLMSQLIYKNTFLRCLPSDSEWGIFSGVKLIIFS